MYDPHSKSGHGQKGNSASVPYSRVKQKSAQKSYTYTPRGRGGRGRYIWGIWEGLNDKGRALNGCSEGVKPELTQPFVLCREVVRYFVGRVYRRKLLTLLFYIIPGNRNTRRVLMMMTRDE